VVTADANATVSVESAILTLLIVAGLVLLFTRLTRLPYTITLVLVGLLGGVLGVLPALTFSPDLAFYVFLPVILFESGLRTPVHHLRRHLGTVAFLAVPGVLLSFVLTAAGLWFAGAGPLAELLVFSALIAATDPVSVVALFRRMRVPGGLRVIVESESLFNDGTAAVLFAIVVASATSGGIGLLDAAGRFAWMAAGGLAVGVGVGLAASGLHRLLDEAIVELMLTTILAYGSFLLAETMNMSGPVACAAAGVTVAALGRRHGMTPGVRQAVDGFWEYAAFIVNSLVFLLIGLRMDVGAISEHIGLVVLAFAVVVLARAVVVYGFGASLRALRRRAVPWSWDHVLVWGGLRGTVALALALSVPADVPSRDSLVVMTFGVVLFSLLTQGLTIPTLVRWLGLAGQGDETTAARGKREQSPT